MGINISGTGTSGVTAGSPPATGNAADPNANAGGQAGAVATTATSKTYTQEQLDQMFGERAKSAAGAAVAALLKELGYEKADDLKAAITKAKSLEDAQKTAEQKLQEQITTLTDEKQKAEKAKEAALARAQEKLMRAAVTTEATTQNFEPSEIETAWLLIKADKALLEQIKPKGEDEFEGVKEVVKKVADAHPKWLKGTAQGAGVGTSRPGGKNSKPPDEKAAEQLAAETRRKYQRSF